MEDTSATQRLLTNQENSDNQQNNNDLAGDVKEFETLVARFLTKVLHGSATLANMLPTGTILFFQVLDPILLRAGSCKEKNLSAAFLIFCSLICFILSFTDSFQAANGKVYYGLATFRGLWTPQLKTTSMDLSKYKIRAGDFAHAFLAVFTFLTTSAFSTDVVSCFFKVPDTFIRAIPSLSGFLVSAVFLMFPTTRHGIGFPLSPTPSSSPNASSPVPKNV